MRVQARFPFLDEEVMWHLLNLPLGAIVDLRLPAGVGDKMILREVRWRWSGMPPVSLPWECHVGQVER